MTLRLLPERFFFYVKILNRNQLLCIYTLKGNIMPTMDVCSEIKKDKEKGAVRLVSEYGNRLYAAALLLCNNDADAEELTYRTFEQAIKKIHQFDAKKNFYTWLYTILLNFRRMDLRKRRMNVIPMGGAEDLPEVASDSFADALADSTSESVANAVRKLSPLLREAVVLRYYEDKSIEEISEILGVAVGTVKSRLFNARVAINDFLTKEKEPSHE
jgi:RNA polymerase sigma-70 factor (ECF subfamily)